MAIEHRKIVEKLCKWRMVFASWQLGTRPDTDPGVQAVKDHREVTIILRCEVNALVKLLTEKGVFTEEEWWQKVAGEAFALDAAYEKRFPGFTSTEQGMAIEVAKAAETMKNWYP